MFPKGRKQLAVVILMGLFITSGTAAQAGGGGLPNRPVRVVQKDRAPEPFFSWAWRWVLSLWEKNGLCIDPNGMCIQSDTGSTPIHPDQGACIEPNGLCAKSTE